MPSTLVHAALAGLLAAALLGRAFRLRTVAVMVGLVILVDLDVFVGYVVLGAHRAAFHTLLWPALGTVALGYDTLVRERSSLVDRFGRDAQRVAWTAVATVVFAGIGPDLVTNGANVFYPVHDQFYAFDGSIKYSTKEGIVQTFVEEKKQVAKGSTEQVQYYTGTDPKPATGGADTGTTTERVFLVVDSGLQLLLVVTSAVVVTGRLLVDGGRQRVGTAAGTGDAPTAAAEADDPAVDGTRGSDGDGGDVEPDGESGSDGDDGNGGDDPWIGVPEDPPEAGDETNGGSGHGDGTDVDREGEDGTAGEPEAGETTDGSGHGDRTADDPESEDATDPASGTDTE